MRTCIIDAVAEANGNKPGREHMTPGTQADDELERMLAAADPAVETSLETLRVSEEHYFAAVRHEGNQQPTTFSSSTEA
jgi:hypothetical protein